MATEISRLSQLLLAVPLLLSAAAIQALEEFSITGSIGKIGYNSFYVNGHMYRLTKHTTIETSTNKNAKLSDLPVGSDSVQFRGKRLDGVNYVDWIVYIPH